MNLGMRVEGLQAKLFPVKLVFNPRQTMPAYVANLGRVESNCWLSIFTQGHLVVRASVKTSHNLMLD